MPRNPAFAQAVLDAAVAFHNAQRDFYTAEHGDDDDEENGADWEPCQDALDRLEAALDDYTGEPAAPWKVFWHTCDTCGKRKADVAKRLDRYVLEVDGQRVWVHTCDDCDEQRAQEV